MQRSATSLAAKCPMSFFPLVRNTAIRSDKISVLFLAQPITRTCVYIKVPYFTSFRFPASSIVGLGLGLVVGLGTVRDSVSFIFLLHFFLFDVC